MGDYGGVRVGRHVMLAHAEYPRKGPNPGALKTSLDTHTHRDTHTHTERDRHTDTRRHYIYTQHVIIHIHVVNDISTYIHVCRVYLGLVFSFVLSTNTSARCTAETAFIHPGCILQIIFKILLNTPALAQQRLCTD